MWRGTCPTAGATAAFIERRFGLLVALSLVGKWLLVSDVAFFFVGADLGDGLDVERAFHLLTDGSLGPYDGQVLARAPGMSWWIAAVHGLGLPYASSLHLAFGAALVLLCCAARRAGLPAAGALAVFVGVLFAPVTIDAAWFSAFAEPVEAILLLILVASAMLVVDSLGRGKLPWVSAPLSGLAVEALGLVRYDSSFVFFALPLCALVAGAPYHGTFRAWLRRRGRHTLFAFALATAVVLFGDRAARSWVKARYGAPILDETAEGALPAVWERVSEFAPRSRSYEPEVSERTLQELGRHVPRFAALLPYLGADCGDAQDCNWSEQALKRALLRAAHRAGLARDLLASQTFQHGLAREIAGACRNGKLDCRARSFEIASRPSLGALGFLLEPVVTTRDAEAPIPPSPSGTMARMALYPRVLQRDSEAPHWRDRPQEIREALWYWLRNPDVARSAAFGPFQPDGTLGALVHYDQNGRLEGRSWGQSGPQALPARPRLVALRQFVVTSGGVLDDLAQLFGVLALFALVVRWKKRRKTALHAGLGVALFLIAEEWFSVSRQRETDPLTLSRMLHPAYLLALAFAFLIVTETISRRLDQEP
jgi:hypothetical protein